MAWVPGGKVMAKVIGAPAFWAASTIGFKALGSFTTLPFKAFLKVMDWPLRLMIQGMIMGFLGDPRRPMVEARGMPISIWVAWISPFESESRIAAQLAPLRTVELMPYFLKKPFSWAMTIGEQSVSAMMPNLRSGISGPSAAYAPPTQSMGRLDRTAAAPRPLATVDRNSRRSGLEQGSDSCDCSGDRFFMRLVLR